MATNSAVLHAETIVDQATPAALALVHDWLNRALAAIDAQAPAVPSSQWRGLFRTAVAEIAANVIRHAYPPSATERPFELEILVYQDRLVAQFADSGVPWEPSETPPAPDPFDLPEGGLGLAVARGAVDELSYLREPDGRNAWRLVKHFAAS